MQSIDSIETYAYGTSKDLVSEKDKCSNIIKRYKNTFRKYQEIQIHYSI